VGICIKEEMRGKKVSLTKVITISICTITIITAGTLSRAGTATASPPMARIMIWLRAMLKDVPIAAFYIRIT